MSGAQLLALILGNAAVSSLMTVVLGWIAFRRWVQPRLETLLAELAGLLEARVKAGAGAAPRPGTAGAARAIERLGDSRRRRIALRIVAATNVDLSKEAAPATYAQLPHDLPPPSNDPNSEHATGNIQGVSSGCGLTG